MGASRKILNELAVDSKWANTAVAYVSRTTEPEWAHACLKLFSVHDGVSMDDLGEHQQIYPGCKKTHFNAIHEDSGIPFKDMVGAGVVPSVACLSMLCLTAACIHFLCLSNSEHAWPGCGLLLTVACYIPSDFFRQ